MSDQFTTDEKVDILFKQFVNKPCTLTSREYFQEPSITTRNFVYQEDIVSYSIPTTAPSDLITLGDNSLDDNGNKLKGSYAGKTSAENTNIRYYHKIPFEFFPGTGGSAWQSINATVSHPGGYADGTTSTNYGSSGSYGRVMQNSIPFNFATDNTYAVSVYKTNGDLIPYGAAGGGFLIEARPGTLKFYQFANITGVDESNIIYCSFFRYVGPTGGVTGNQVTSMITSVNNDFTAQQVFTGGVNSATNDTLSAIMIDNRDISSLGVGELLDALQFGGNYDGSWRTCVQRTSNGSQFLLQARQSGAWVTKSSWTIP